MGSFSNYAENKVLDHIVGKTSFAMPTAYIALSTADPLDTGGGIAEPVGNNYARKSTAGADWAAALGGSISNANAITFNQASGSWGTISHFALFDASSGGNMIAHGQLSQSKAVANGDTPSFASGQLTITLD